MRSYCDIIGDAMNEKIRVYYSNQPSNYITVDQAISLVTRHEAVWINHWSIRLMSTPARTRRKFNVLKNDGYVCYICGRQLSESDESITVDHIVSKKTNGPFHECNLRCCCYDCNTDKASKSLVRYVETISTLNDKSRYPWATEEKLQELLCVHELATIQVRELQAQTTSRPALTLEE
jgi:5-methylcytosine-specific restriction endonuclease McrA